MSLENLIAENRKSILKRWIDLVIDSYHQDTAQFLRRQKDGIANPVGQDIRWSLEGVLNQMLEGISRDKVTPFLDRLVRIRVVQSFTPSQALAFVFGLKGLVREVLAKELEAEDLAEELAGFEARVDEVALMAFDLYAAAQKSLADIRIRDEQRRIHMLLRRANIISENMEEEIELPDLRGDGHQTNNEAR